MSAAYRNAPLRTENLLCPLFRGGSFSVFGNLGKSCRPRVDDKLPPELGLKFKKRTFDRSGRLLVPLEAISNDLFQTVFREQTVRSRRVFFLSCHGLKEGLYRHIGHARTYTGFIHDTHVK